MALKLQNIYNNPYEFARARLRSNPLYNNEDWISIARGNNPLNLDAYIYALDKMPKTEAQLKKFEDDYYHSYGDSQNRIAAISNEIFTDRKTLIKRKRPITDENGNYLYKDGHTVSPDAETLDPSKLQYEEYEITDYDYYKQLIRNNNYQAYLRHVTDQLEADKSHRERTLTAFAGFGAEMSSGLIEELNNIGKFFNGVGQFIDAMFKGEDVAKAFNEGVVAGGSKKLTDAQRKIIEWEMINTTMRNASTGEYTTVGKYLGGMGDSVGRMLPSITVNLLANLMSYGTAGIATSLSKGAADTGIHGLETAANVLSKTAYVGTKIMSIASQGLFYAAMDAQMVQEMYNWYAKEGLSIPHAAIMLNAGLKSAAQWAIEVGLAKIMGGSALDNLVFGRGQSFKGLGKTNAFLKILSDANEEGTEEVLQDWSDWIIDAIFSKTVDENFGRFTEVTSQTMFDAYIIAFVTSLGGSAVQVARTKRVNTSNVKYDKKGEVVKDKDGNIKNEKLSKLQSYAYRLSMQDWISDADRIIKLNNKAMATNNTEAIKKYSNQAVNLFKQFTALSQIYEEIGEERFKNANDVLQEISNTGYLTPQGREKLSSIKGDVLSLRVSLERYGVYDATDAKSREYVQNELKKKLEERGLTQIKEVINKKNLAEAKPEVATKFDKFIKDTEGTDHEIQNLVVTDGGKDLFYDRHTKTLFVPDNYITYADGSENTLSYHSIAEQEMIETVASGKYFKGNVLEKILTKFREVYKADATMEEAVMNIMFNTSFFEIMLIDANQDMYQFLTSLKDIHDALVTNGKHKDVVTQVEIQKYNKVIDKLKQVLINYLVNQQNASVDISILTEKERKKVKMERWCKDLNNRIVNGDKLSEDDLRVLRTRINALNMSKMDKEIMYNNLLSKDAETRSRAMNNLARQYYNVFMSEYNGLIYMPQYCIPNQMFNNYLQSNGITIETLSKVEGNDVEAAKTELDVEELSDKDIVFYRQSMFEKSTDGKYTFKYDAGSVTIKEVKTQKSVGFSTYMANANAIANDKTTDVRKTIVTDESTNRDYIRELIDENVDDATREYLSVNDIILEPSLLKDSVQRKIMKKYKEVNPHTAFLYLRDYIISRSKGNSSIVAKQNGKYVMATITNMRNIWRKGKTVIASDIKSGMTLKEIVKDDYLVGSVADTKIVVIDGDEDYAEYVRYDASGKFVNAIILYKGVLESDSLAFTVAHEIQHAIQAENQFNLGFDGEWLNKITSKETRTKIVKDIKKHKPELFEGKPESEWERIANDFVYLACGESQAMGLEGNPSYMDFEPVIVQRTAKSNVIIMPWGKQYVVRGIEGAIAGMSLRKIFSDEIINNEAYRDWKQTWLDEHPDVYNPEKFTNNFNENVISDLSKSTIVFDLLQYVFGFNASKLTYDTEIPFMALGVDKQEVIEISKEIVPIETYLFHAGFIDEKFEYKALNLFSNDSLPYNKYNIKYGVITVGELAEAIKSISLVNKKNLINKPKSDILYIALNNTSYVKHFSLLGKFYRNIKTGQFQSMFDTDNYTSLKPDNLSIKGLVSYNKLLQEKLLTDDYNSVTKEDYESSKKANKGIDDILNSYKKDIEQRITQGLNIDKDFIKNALGFNLLRNNTFNYLDNRQIYDEIVKTYKDTIDLAIDVKFYTVAEENLKKFIENWINVSQFEDELDRTDNVFTLLLIDTLTTYFDGKNAQFDDELEKDAFELENFVVFDKEYIIKLVKDIREKYDIKDESIYANPVYYEYIDKAALDLMENNYDELVEHCHINKNAVTKFKQLLMSETQLNGEDLYYYKKYLNQLIKESDDTDATKESIIPLEYQTVYMSIIYTLCSSYNVDLTYYNGNPMANAGYCEPGSGKIYVQPVAVNAKYFTINKDGNFRVGKDVSDEQKYTFYNLCLHEVFHSLISSVRFRTNTVELDNVRKFLTTIITLYNSDNKYIKNIALQDVKKRWGLYYAQSSDKTVIDKYFEEHKVTCLEELAAEYFSKAYSFRVTKEMDVNSKVYPSLTSYSKDLLQYNTTDEMLQNMVLDLHEQLHILPLDTSFNNDFLDEENSVLNLSNDVYNILYGSSLRKAKTDEERILKYEQQGYKNVHIEYNTTGKGEWTSKVVCYDENGIKHDFDYKRANMYVSVEKQKNTNLKYFGQTQMAENMQKFIIEADEEQLAPELWERIGGKKKGTLTHKNVMEYLLQTELEDIDQYTFNLINKCFFKNEYIKTPQELEWFVDNTAEFYALATIIEAFGRKYEDLMTKVKTDAEVEELFAIVKADPELKKAWESYTKEFDKILYQETLDKLLAAESKYGKDTGKIIERYDSNNNPIDTRNLRRLFLLNYNGTLSSAKAVGAIAKVVAMRGYNTTSSIQTAKLTSGQDSHNDETDLDVLENIASTDEGIFEGYISTESQYYDYAIQLLEWLTDMEKTKLYKEYSDKMFTDTGLKSKALIEYIRRRKGFVNKIADSIYEPGKKGFANQYRIILAMWQSNREEYEKIAAKVEARLFGQEISLDDEEDVKFLRKPRTIATSIKHMTTTIKNAVPKKYYWMVLDKNSDIFDENLDIKPEAYLIEDSKGKKLYADINTLISLQERVRNISEEYRVMFSPGMDTVRAAERFAEKELKKQQRKIEQEFDRERRSYERTIREKDVQIDALRKTERIGDVDVTYSSPVKMPRIFKRFLATEFDETRKSQIQFDKIEENNNFNREYAARNFSKFLQKYASVIMQLDQKQVDELVEFLVNSQMDSIGQDANLYNSLRMAMIGLLLEGTSVGNWTISEEQRTKLENNLGKGINASASALANFKTLIKQLHPEKIIAASLKKSFGIDYEGLDEDIEAVLEAAKYQNTRPSQLMDAKKRLYENALKSALDKKKNVFDILLRIQRTMMLSGPGTWIRNLSSNVNVSTFNALSDIMMSVLDKSKKVQERVARIEENTGLKQYKIVGTKTDPKYKDWIELTLFGYTEEMGKKLTKEQKKLLSENSFWSQFKTVWVNKYDENTNEAKGYWERIRESNDIIGKLVSKSAVKEASIEGARLGAILMDRATKKGIEGWRMTMVKIIDKIDKTGNSFIYKMISDDPFVKRKFVYYLGKMLTEDNVDINDKRVSEKAMSVIADAYILACNDYMHSTNIVNDVDRIIRTKLGPTANFVYKQIFPFLAPSLNWFAEGLKYSPIGLIRAIVRYARLENTINKMEERRQRGELSVTGRFGNFLAKRDIGKGLIGTAGWIIGIALVASGKAGIDDRDDKMKLFVGDVSVDITSLFGMQGILMGIAMASAIKNIVNTNHADLSDKDKAKRYLNYVIDVFKATADQMFIDSVFSDLFNTFRYADNISDYFTALPFNSLQMFVPNMVKTFTMFNKYQTKYESGITGKFEKLLVNMIPQIAYALPKKVDPYTGENQVMFKVWWLTQFVNKLSPVDIYPYNVSEAEKQAILLGLNKGQLTGKYTINGEKLELDGKQVQILNEKYGKLNKDELALLMNNKQKYTVQNEQGKYEDLYYRQMTDKQKAAVINRIMTNNSSYAKISILTSLGYKYYASDSDYKRLQKLGIRTNVYKANKQHSEGFENN